IGAAWRRLLLPDDSAAAALADLRNCPWLATRAAAPTPWAEALDWLQARWLHMAPDTWLRLWRSDGADWLRAWSERHDGWLARLLHAARLADVALDLNAVPALRPHGPQEDPYALGRGLAGHDTEPAALEWQGQPAHAGSWTRRRDAATSKPASAWALLGGRIAELVRLSLPDDPAQGGAGWLHWGARPLGPGQALAWVEMARGLLIHYVQLDGVADGESRVAACQVLAPTDWNFHPRGGGGTGAGTLAGRQRPRAGAARAPAHGRTGSLRAVPPRRRCGGAHPGARCHGDRSCMRQAWPVACCSWWKRPRGAKVLRSEEH